jgi:ribose transport system ATP-binding protein
MTASDNVPKVSRGGAQALEVRGVTKSFAGVTVLRDVEVVIRPSSVHALVGHNGSGKSTFIKALAGFHAPDTPVTGTTFGRPFSLGDHAAAARAGLRFVHQDLGLVEQLSTAENLAFGPGFPRRAGGTIRWREVARRAVDAMSALGYDVDVTMPVGSLSASERTGVAIARSLERWSGEPAVVVLDEPTASMPDAEVRRLFATVERLREQGLGILYVSHHLDEILELADDVTVLRNGHVVMSRPMAGLSHDNLVTAIVGRELVSIMQSNATREPSPSRQAVLDVKDLATPRIRGSSFSIEAGEIVGVAGVTGSGRDDVLPAIAAAKNITVSGLRRHARFGLLNHRADAADAREWLSRLDVLPANPAAPILTLSGGNQQKVMIGRWLRRRPTIFALDEPTQGVDIGARQTIYQALRQAAEEGNGVLISSSDSDELAANCHRVIVFARGHIVAELTGAQLEAQHIDAVSLSARGEVAS